MDRLEARIALSVGDAIPASTLPQQRIDSYAIQRHQQILAEVQAQHDDVVFLGDSMVDNWDAIAESSWDRKIAPFGAANFGVASNFTQNLLWQLRNGELAGRPQLAVVEIGTNNILFESGDPDARVKDTVAGIKSVVSTIRTLSPETKVLLMGLFPQGEQPDDPARLEIQQVNAQIATIADGVDVRFLDIGSIFLQPDGTRAPTPYGIHPTPQNYDAWADAIHCPVQQMLGRPCAPGVQKLRTTDRTRRIRTIDVTFNEALNAHSAQDPANYTLTRTTPGSSHRRPQRFRPIPIEDVLYDPVAQTTTLVLKRPLKPAFRYELTINGATPSGVRDLFGILLDGSADGSTGRSEVVAINPRTLTR